MMRRKTQLAFLLTLPLAYDPASTVRLPRLRYPPACPDHLHAASAPPHSLSPTVAAAIAADATATAADSPVVLKAH